MVFNSSSNFYKDLQSKEAYLHGRYEYNVTCINPNAAYSLSLESNLTIINIPPFISHSLLLVNNIDNYSVTDLSYVEFSSGLWEFFSAVSDDDLDFVRYVVRNSSAASYTNSSRT